MSCATQKGSPSDIMGGFLEEGLPAFSPRPAKRLNRKRYGSSWNSTRDCNNHGGTMNAGALIDTSAGSDIYNLLNQCFLSNQKGKSLLACELVAIILSAVCQTDFVTLYNLHVQTQLRNASIPPCRGSKLLVAWNRDICLPHDILPMTLVPLAYRNASRHGRSSLAI